MTACKMIAKHKKDPGAEGTPGPFFAGAQDLN